jgi:hypothetical protein
MAGALTLRDLNDPVSCRQLSGLIGIPIIQIDYLFVLGTIIACHEFKMPTASNFDLYDHTRMYSNAVGMLFLYNHCPS